MFSFSKWRYQTLQICSYLFLNPNSELWLLERLHDRDFKNQFFKLLAIDSFMQTYWNKKPCRAIWEVWQSEIYHDIAKFNFRRVITINKMRPSFQPPVPEFKNAVDSLSNAADRINSHQHIAYMYIKNFHKL